MQQVERPSHVAKRFAALPQAAFEVLIDPKQRAVYDTWAKELQFRYGGLHAADIIPQVWLG